MLYIILAIYLAIIGGLGYLAYCRTKSDADYLIAGGDNHPYLMAMAYGSTFISTSAIVGFGGVAGLFGMGLLWLTFFNIFVGIFIAFVFFGKRTLSMGRELKAHTFPEFLGKRYNSQFIQQYAGTIILLSMPLYASAVMIGAARFMEETLNMDYRIAVYGFAVIVGIYVMSSGLKGVLYTDAFQGTIMFFGMITLLILTYAKFGGVIDAHKSLSALNNMVPESLAQKGHMGWTSMPAFGSEYWWVLVSTIVLGVGIGVLAQPQLVVRYLTVKGPKELNRAVAIGGTFILMMTGVVFIVGALTNVYFVESAGKISLLATIDPAVGIPNVDRIIPLYINQTMPQWFTYLFMLTLMSAAMSTLSGQFHAIGTSISHDLFRKSGLLGNRIAIVAALFITVLLTFRMPPSIIAVATAMFFGICAATFLPVYAGALYWKRVTKEGAVASMIVGSFMSLFLMAFVHAKEAAALGISEIIFGKTTLTGFPWTVVDPMIISLPISALTLIAVSLLTQPQKTTQTDSEWAA